LFEIIVVDENNQEVELDNDLVLAFSLEGDFFRTDN
jgi:hypothetical protein